MWPQPALSGQRKRSSIVTAVAISSRRRSVLAISRLIIGADRFPDSPDYDPNIIRDCFDLRCLSGSVGQLVEK
jgi:hypothetical protein